MTEVNLTKLSCHEHVKFTQLQRYASILCVLSILGELRTKGIVIPTTKDLYVPILEKLKEDGIEAKTVQLSGVMM